jgi:imidazolonepropionase
MILACFSMGMTFEEALVAATLNAAYSLNRHETVGSLEPGKSLDALLVEGHSLNLLRAGTQPIHQVIKGGRIIRATENQSALAPDPRDIQQGSS